MAASTGQPNYYEILGVTRENTVKEITKAFRKKALIVHPDKNPDNPKAAELFHELSEALKILTDPKAKAAFDAVLKAKELAKLRTQALDAKRKKLKQDLEAREAFAQREKEDDNKAKHNLEEEVKRLREEGSKLLKEQQELIKTQVEKEKKEKQGEHITPKLKLRWKSRKDDHDNGGYNDEILRNMFEKYGAVINVILSLKKNGLAIVEFKNPSHAMIAMEFEHGLEENPLTISWLQGHKTESGQSNADYQGAHAVSEERKSHPEKNSEENSFTQPLGDDFENMVLLRMKMAQQKKNEMVPPESKPS
eukprot:Seg1058.4 transcript_id=Seg1058.4/GoldUCD/mRNA.D3Y31 product="DnaJ subfamily C member 17" protein_id=Seg1058.4/GoldUCD/D3Y31